MDDLHRGHRLRLARVEDTEAAVLCLGGLPGVHCHAEPGSGCVQVEYQLNQHTLTTLTAALEARGIALAQDGWARWQREWWRYGEEVQLDNAEQPPLDSKGRAAFSSIYQHHPHGDSDDTPEDLRHE